MRFFLAYLITLTTLCGKGQQTIMYTQYTFNKAGVNPAASGINIEHEYSYAFGLNRQWVGLENSPKSNFFNFSYTIRPPRSYKRWQNAGLYADVDDSGLMTSSGVYGTYAVHFLLRKKMIASVGVFVGARRYTRSLYYLDPNDPAFAKNKSAVIIYPDIIPGVRLSEKKYFVGLSVRQITINKLQDFKGRKIGSPSRLNPSIYFEYGRLITLSDNLLMMPSVAVNSPILSPPIADFSLMFYLANRVGAGISVRNASFFSGIFQIRFLKNMTAGFAYSYPINATKFAAKHSYEVMIGVVPFGMATNITGRHSIAKCPTLSY
jgi:type IX secretion system PorP/SprF family membrane protein